MYSTYSKCGLFVLLTFFLSSVTGIAQVNTCACDFAECNNLISNGEFEYVGTEIFDGALPGIETAHCWFKWDEGTTPHLLETNTPLMNLFLSEELPPELGLSNTYVPCIGGSESFYTQTLLPLNGASGPYTLRFYYYALGQSTFAVGFTEDFVSAPSPSDNIFVSGISPLLYGGNIEAQIGEWVLYEQQINIVEGEEMNFFYVARRYQGVSATIFFDNISITPVTQQSIVAIELEGIETQICQGSDVNLNVLSDIYCPLSWTADGNEFSTASSVVVNPSETTTYTVDTTDPCYTESQITIEVLPVAPFELDVSSNEICAGQAVVLTCSDQNLIYDWSPSIVAFPDMNYLKVATFVESTNVVVSTNGDNGCSFQQEVYITVNPNPVFTLSANSTNLCPQESAVIQASNASLNYTWTGSGITSQAGNTITVSPSQTSNYTAVATNGQCTDIETIQISVNPTLIITADVLNSIDDLCNGQITVSTNYSGSAADLDFLWLYNGSPTGSNSQTIVGLCPGNYICMCTTANGCTGYLNVTTYSISAPEIDAVVQNDACLSPQGSGSISLSSLLDFTIQWTGPNGFSSSSNTISSLSAGNYVASFYFDGFPMFQQSYAITAMAGTNLGVIDASENLNGQTLVVSGNITVETGVTWVVNNSTLYMQGNGRIIIEPGGKLIAKTSTFTNGCSTFWSGIEVWALSNNPLYESQGKVELTDNCIIEHALIGVRAGQAVASSLNSTIQNTGGGKIFAQNSSFRNNQRDAQFKEYIYAYGPSSSSIPTIKPVAFDNCIFLIDEINLNYPYMDKVSLKGAKNIWFKNCDFINLLPQVLENTIAGGTPTLNALFAYGGYVNIHDCDFNGFPRGISLRSGSTLLSKIMGCTFKCYRGILVQNCANIKIQLNTFYPIHSQIDEQGNQFPAVSNYYMDNMEDEDFSDDEYYVDYINNIQGNTWNSSYGVYIENPILLSLSNNYFNLTGPENVLRVGAYVTGNGANNNDVKSNSFIGCSVGMRFYNSNRGGNPNQGLQFSCNLFEENISDVEINAHPSAFLDDYTNLGVRANLGSVSFSRANQFDESTNLNLSENLYSHNEMLHNYYYSEDIDGDAEILPSECSPSITTIFVPGSTSSCLLPEFYTDTNFNYEISNYINIKETYNSVVDGGNKPETLEEILEVTYAEALELYYSLMAKSPALSEDAMIELIKKETEVPDILLTSILASNPTAAKSTIVQKALDEKEFPLSTYQRQMIDQGRFVLSLKENLEIEMSDKQSSLNEYTLLFAESLLVNDQYTESWEDHFEDFLLARADFSSAVALIDLYLEQRRFSEAFVMSNSLLSVLSPKTSEFSDITAVQFLIPLSELIYSDSTSHTIALYKEELESFIQYEHPAASRIAGNLLCESESYSRDEELNYTFIKMESRNTKSSISHAENHALVAPNPAREFSILTLPKKYLGLPFTISILDLSGQSQGAIEGKSTQEQTLLEMQELASGIYIVRIKFENGDILEEKLIKL